MAMRSIGDTVNLIGRIQSRQYVKNTEHGPEERTAFEISIVTLDESEFRNQSPPVFDEDEGERSDNGSVFNFSSGLDENDNY